MHIVICRATATKITQNYGKATEESKWYAEKLFSTKTVKEEQILKRHIENKVAGLNPTMSIIILNISGLNTIIKRQLLSDWIKKSRFDGYCL